MGKIKTTKNTSTGPSTFTGGGIRLLLFTVVALQWLCGVVNLGLTTYFMNYWGAGLHTMFGLVVGCVSSWCYFGYMWLTFIRAYKGYFLLLNLTFSHLWLTYFIFNALDYNSTEGCIVGEPEGVNDCGKKHSLEAMSFAAFFFTLLAIPLDLLLYIRERRNVPAVQRVNVPRSDAVVLAKENEETEAEISGANVV